MVTNFWVPFCAPHPSALSQQVQKDPSSQPTARCSRVLPQLNCSVEFMVAPGDRCRGEGWSGVNPRNTRSQRVKGGLFHIFFAPRAALAKQVVLKAVAADGTALMFVSESMQSDKDFCVRLLCLLRWLSQFLDHAKLNAGCCISSRTPRWMFLARLGSWAIVFINRIHVFKSLQWPFCHSQVWLLNHWLPTKT